MTVVMGTKYKESDMSEEEKTDAAPVDDAAVVHDDPVAAEEKADAEIVAKVTKLLDKDPVDETTAEDQPDSGEEKPSKVKEPKGEEPAELSDELQVRAEGAGITKELAQSLHQSGHLEETLVAFDRRLIERFQSKETEEEPKQQEPGVAREKALPKEDQKDSTDLDPEIYDEELVKRDAYHKRRIDALESKVAELAQVREDEFDKRFDGMVDGLGHADLFGKNGSAPKDKQANRDVLFRAYQAVCQAYDVDPHECDSQWGKRALAAMFPEEVTKKVQRQTVDRLRNAEGKFLSSSKSKGAPPSKDASDEEVHDKLVSDVTSLLKERGVSMSGV